MGAQPGTYAAELSSVADIPDVPEISGYGTPTDLLRRRPDIIAAERMVAASNARIGQALAEYYPKLSLSGIVGSQALAPEIRRSLKVRALDSIRPERSEEHTSELQSPDHLVCRLQPEKKNRK